MSQKRIISFDGLHRAGKGSQIKLLYDHLTESGVMVRVFRGDGTRKGDGNRFDPKSKWWRDFHEEYKPHKKLNDTDIWDRASDRLNEELVDDYNVFRVFNPYILMDRSIISRYYMKKREDSSVTLDDVVLFQTGQGEVKEVMIPDISFILHVSKQQLLARNEELSDMPEKYAFRKKNILRYHESFEDITRSSDLGRLNIVHIDGDKPKNVIHGEILSYIGGNGNGRQKQFYSGNECSNIEQ